MFVGLERGENTIVIRVNSVNIWAFLTGGIIVVCGIIGGSFFIVGVTCGSQKRGGHTSFLVRNWGGKM